MPAAPTTAALQTPLAPHALPTLPTPLTPPAPPTSRPVISRRRAAFALALLLGLQPITTDVFLPALPALTRALAAPMNRVQLTMSALILAFGIAQLAWGPVADRVGRRPVLLLGLVLYTAASIGAALAGSIEALVAWRVLQGAALASAVVCARALVRDLYEPLEGAQVMSLGLSGLAVIALLGPLLGGLATAWFDWRAALVLVSIAGALTLGWVAWGLPETAPRLNPHATRPGPLLRQWGTIARHPAFVAWTMLISASYGGLFVILAGSSFVYIGHLGLSPLAYGAAMASGSFAYMIGTFVCRRWVASAGMERAVARAAWATLSAGLSIVGLAWAGVESVWALLVPQWLFAFGHGIHQPCGQAGAVGPFPNAAGAAAALAGSLLAATAFLVGLWIGHAMHGAPLPYALGVGVWALATSMVAWTRVRRLAPAR
jgi:DHA1 family bicyclomycin/chloramphenicol resistance-like MFS transporter